MAKQKTEFICSECGYKSSRWLGKCQNCGSWNTMTEEIVVEDQGFRGVQAYRRCA